jgi:hypothetical protein
MSEGLADAGHLTDLGLGIPDDPRERRQAMPLDGALGGDDGDSRAAGDAQRVAGGHCAGLIAQPARTNRRADLVQHADLLPANSSD